MAEPTPTPRPTVTAVNSSMLDQVFYNPATQEMTVDFVKGGNYTYSGVPPEVAAAIVAAPSVGKAMHALVLPAQYPYRRNG
jgi:phage gp45-like